MTTAFQTGPGFYAANTNVVDPSLPPGVVRFFCVRLEAYDVADDPDDEEIAFEIIFAKAEKNPQIAKALLDLARSIQMNEANLKEIAGE